MTVLGEYVSICVIKLYLSSSLCFPSFLPVEACKALEVLFNHFDVPLELDTQEGWVDVEDRGDEE